MKRATFLIVFFSLLGSLVASHVEARTVRPVKRAVKNSSGYICSYNAYNCSNFTSHAEAQKAFLSCGGISNDIHRLDADKDGLACEKLK